MAYGKNKKYRKGVRKEYSTIKRLREHGWFCVRSAGSHGAADIVAIHKERGLIYLIQCKTYQTSENKKQAILGPLIELEGQYNVKAVLL